MTTNKPVLLVTGSNGQLGRQIMQDFAEDFEIVPTDYKELDITDNAACHTFFDKFKPRWVINAAAYTDVERAEDEPEKAMLINRDGPRNLAECAKAVNGRLLHISTDYVFDGTLRRPLKPSDPIGPKSVYGRTKLAGEEAIEAVLGKDTLIIRTAWLYSAVCKNFMLTMLRLMKEKPFIKVVADQYGTPTSVLSLSQAMKAAIKADARGIFHWTDAGETTWHGFACEIQKAALKAGILDHSIDVLPVSTSEYPTKAVRPLWSVLDKSDITKAAGIAPEPWEKMLEKTLAVLISQQS